VGAPVQNLVSPQQLVVSVAGYLAVAGGVISAVSQMTVDDDAKSEEDSKDGDNENFLRIK
jgi:hypothetical protein